MQMNEVSNKMNEVISFTVTTRTGTGKGAARAARRSGLIPGVIYGNKQNPEVITVEPKLLLRELHRPGFFARLFNVELNGKKQQVLARDVQLHPATDRPLHVDFMRVDKNSKIHVNVPVHFTNQDKSPGLRRGGVLNIVRHEIEIICGVQNIPREILIDLTGYEINSSIHISMVKLPEGTKPAISERDFTVATIVPPTVEKVVDAAADAAAPAAGATPAAAS